LKITTKQNKRKREKIKKNEKRKSLFELSFSGGVLQSEFIHIEDIIPIFLGVRAEIPSFHDVAPHHDLMDVSMDERMN